ncbi:putative signal peptide protein [Halorubrum sp. AJ67]|nr:putative signal peptide protein [Halorubrum sp. AJ67]
MCATVSSSSPPPPPPRQPASPTVAVPPAAARKDRRDAVRVDSYILTETGPRGTPSRHQQLKRIPMTPSDSQKLIWGPLSGY